MSSNWGGATSLPGPAQSGFTFVELMAVVAIVAILLTVGLPSYVGFVERNRLKSASEGLVSDLNFARSEAILRGPNGRMNVSFSADGSNNWCYGMTTADSCNCTITNPETAGACVISTTGPSGTETVLKRVSSDEFQGDVTMEIDAMPAVDGYSTVGFSALRGLSDASQVSLGADSNSIQVEVSLLGQIRVCTPSGTNVGYRPC